jgi:hypothetical protein
MQRMSYIGPVYNSTTITVPYVDTTGLTDEFSSKYPYTINQDSEIIQGLYTVSLMSPPIIQSESMDMYNNTKIPLLDTTQDDWYPVHTTTAADYSSMLGIPFAIPAHDIGGSLYDPTYSGLDLTIQSAYLSVTNCTPQVIMSKDAINQTIVKSGTSFVQSSSGTLIMSMKLLGDYLPFQGASGVGGSFSQKQLPGIITFSSSTSSNQLAYEGEQSDSTWSYTACNIDQTFVDSQISCSGNQCQVVALRPSSNTTIPRSYLSMNYTDGTGSQPSPYFLQYFVNAGASSVSSEGVLTLAEKYIFDPGFVINSAPSTAPNLATIPLPKFQQRLALVLNTYWQAGMAPVEQTTQVNISSPYTTPKNATDATYTQGYDAYQVSWGWIAVLFISSVILLAAGIASIIFDMRTIGPDVLGFASSLTRNNKYMDLPKDKDHGTMSGAERTRALGDVKVMMQDVKPGAPVGKIALGTVSEGTRRLARDRVYK